jgi:hypothetical protein
MKSRMLLASVAISAALILNARADLVDNFDSYASQAALLAAWNATAPTGTGLQLSQSTPTPVSSPNDVEVTTTASYRLVRAFGAGNAIAAPSIHWSFNFYDGGGSRDFASLYAYTGAWGAGLQTALQFGVYNTGVGNKYMARYSSITGAVYSDGATATTADGGTGGWFSLTSAASRGTGAWHSMVVWGSVDPGDSTKLKLSFYVDGVLGGSVANINGAGPAPYLFTYATLGGAVSTTAAGSAFDNFSAIPEPSSLTLGLLGGLALALRTVARRREG